MMSSYYALIEPAAPEFSVTWSVSVNPSYAYIVTFKLRRRTDFLFVFQLFPQTLHLGS